MRALVFSFFLFSAIAYPLDIDSYCKGLCMNRYQDGIERGGQCACIDYYPINTTGRIDQISRPKKVEN